MCIHAWCLSVYVHTCVVFECICAYMCGVLVYMCIHAWCVSVYVHTYVVWVIRKYESCG